MIVQHMGQDAVPILIKAVNPCRFCRARRNINAPIRLGTRKALDTPENLTAPVGPVVQSHDDAELFIDRLFHASSGNAYSLAVLRVSLRQDTDKNE